MNEKAKQISALLAPTVQALGLELLGIEYLPAPGGATLRLYIDVSDADRETREVNIDDCEKVSREVSAQLDVEDPISGNYTLEVSSPGIERPLFAPEHFARHLGEEAKVALRLPQDGRRRLLGRIVAVNEGRILFDADGIDIEVAHENIEKARLVPDWVALGLAPQPKKKPAAGKKAAGANKQKT
ncbi:MAG: ribosome maturation factor RimP [Pseudoxanthomonas sp.]